MAFIVLSALTAQSAAAQWQPLWSMSWQHPEPLVSASPSRIRVASDVSAYAAASVTHNSLSHVALMRFGADGAFTWLQEHRASVVSGLVFIDANRLAMSGDGGGAATPVDIRVYDTNSGVLIWDRQVGGGHVLNNAIYDTPQLVLDAVGNLMVLASDQGDYVVIRFDPNGNALPAWRYQVEVDSNVTATGIVALPDGGAVLTGRGQSFDGNVTARLDANGDEVFTDIEFTGPHPFGAGYIGLDNEGGVIVAAARENSSGSPQARVWKLSPTGARLWTTFLPSPNFPNGGTSIGGFALDANGDPMIAVGDFGGSPFRLVRLDGTTGDVVRNTYAPISGTPRMLAIAESGRVLIGGDGPIGGGRVSGRMAEFTADGEPCRVAGNMGIFSSLSASAGPNGWSVLGATSFVQGIGNEVFVSQFDSGGGCTLTDSVFADGFEPQLP